MGDYGVARALKAKKLKKRFLKKKKKPKFKVKTRTRAVASMPSTGQITCLVSLIVMIT